jgi:hypothetical protein
VLPRKLALRGWPLVFAAVWCLLSILVLVPVWHQRMLPMLDTPDHLALARAWHDYHDPASRIAEYYLLRIRLVPYLLFYFLIHVLLYVFPIEVANKLVLSAYLLLFPLSLWALARALHRSPWLALGGFALAFNPCWIYGFTSYLLGTTFVFFGWAALVSALDDGARRHFVTAGLLCILCYVAHVLAWFVFGLGAIALLVLDRRRWRRCLVAAAALAPSLLLAVITWVQERHERAYTSTGNKLVAQWRDVPTLVAELPTRMMELFPGALDFVALGVLALTVVVLLAWPARTATAEEAHGTRRLRWLLWVLMLAYLSLPFTVKQPMSWWYVGARLPALMSPLVLLLPTARLDGWRHALLAPMVLACIVLPLWLTRLYTDFSRRNVGFMRLIDRLPRGSRTMVLARGHIHGDAESSGDPSSSGPVYWHFMSWPMALKGGMSPYLFDQGIPVRPRPGLPQYNVNRTVTLTFQNASEFDYYLVPTQASDLDFGDRRVREVDALGGWSLFQRIIPQTDEP